MVMENEKFVGNLKRAAVSGFELLAAGCMVGSLVAVLAMWFLVSCCVSYGLLQVAVDDEGKRIDAMELLKIKDREERAVLTSKILKKTCEKFALQTCCSLVGVMAVAKAVAWWLSMQGIEV